MKKPESSKYDEVSTEDQILLAFGERNYDSIKGIRKIEGKIQELKNEENYDLEKESQFTALLSIIFFRMNYNMSLLDEAQKKGFALGIDHDGDVITSGTVYH